MQEKVLNQNIETCERVLFKFIKYIYSHLVRRHELKIRFWTADIGSTGRSKKDKNFNCNFIFAQIWASRDNTFEIILMWKFSLFNTFYDVIYTQFSSIRLTPEINNNVVFRLIYKKTFMLQTKIIKLKINGKREMCGRNEDRHG